jgi:hypothetical protein
LSPYSPAVADTLGYILLQLGCYEDARKLYGRFLAVDRKNRTVKAESLPKDRAPAFVGGGPQFRYAKVLERLGSKSGDVGMGEDATILFESAKRLGYQPTHEEIFVETSIKTCDHLE